MRDIVTDTTTNRSFFRGRDGREHTLAAVAAAERRAAEGDEEARALLESLEIVPNPTGDFDPEQLMMQILHNCPECRAALARGEKPIFASGHDLLKPNTRNRSYKNRSGVDRWRKRKRGQ